MSESTNVRKARSGFMNAVRFGPHVPQGLKPAFFEVLNGTAEAVPHPKPIYQTSSRSAGARRQRGFTLIELIVATGILAILVGAAFPLVKMTIYREREHELREDLWMMRDAIDRYKDAADRGAFQTKVGSENYPPDLDTLVTGVDISGKKMKFLRRIPVDPMTKQEWGMRSMQDDKDSDSWGGQNVFDVYTKSDQTALDGTKYKDW
jgi:general secretion pathway protein G